MVPSEVDRIWLSFRDRYGLVWGQRMREQFNAAATHAGWPVRLHWRGLRMQSGAAVSEARLDKEIVATLRALFKRFDAVETEDGPEQDASDQRTYQ
jgi:hypothetical protein